MSERQCDNGYMAIEIVGLVGVVPLARFTPEEPHRIREHFEAQGIPPSVGVRALALREIRGR